MSDLSIPGVRVIQRAQPTRSNPSTYKSLDSFLLPNSSSAKQAEIKPEAVQSEYVTNIMATSMQGIKAANALPIGNDHDYWMSNTEIKAKSDGLRERISNLLHSLVTTVRCYYIPYSI